MVDFALVLSDAPLNDRCGVCDEAALWGRGPRMLHLPSGRPVCRECGRHRAPQHAAIVDLLRVADHVGRHSRHLLTPAMKSLLDLARAAEVYATATGPIHAKAG
jgi:hypothetical protein